MREIVEKKKDTCCESGDGCEKDKEKKKDTCCESGDGCEKDKVVEEGYVE